MAEQLARKKRIRAGHRSSATKMIGQIYEALEGAEINLSRLRHQKEGLEEKLIHLQRLDLEILDLLAEDDDFTEEIEQADACKGKLQLAIIDLEAAVVAKSTDVLSIETSPREGRVEPVPSERPRVSSPTPSPRLSPSSTPSPGHHGPRVKLPKLVLKRFAGDPTEWTTFWDSFESAVHTNPDLTGMDKFNYLHSLLDKSAAEAVSGLKLTAANYEEAVSILRKRFGNKQQIINKHMDALLALEPATSHGLKSLRHFFDRVESHVRGLRALDVPSSSYGGLLTSVLMNKLPQDMRLVVSRKVSEDDWNLDVLMKIVEEEIDARERAGSLAPTGPLKKHVSKDGQPTAASLFTKGSVISCVYCDQNHQSASCRMVTDAETRKQRLRRTGRCFICLKRFHMGRNCRSGLKCPNCNGRHHVSICQSLKEEGKPSDTTGTNVGGKKPWTAPTTSMYASARTPILLQTARTHVSQPERPDLRVDTCVIFDCGSQRSYVTETLKNRLALPVKSVDTLMVKTFGSSEEQVHHCEVVDLLLETRGGECLQLSFLAVPLICDPLVSQPLSHVVKMFPHLAELDLVDTGNESNIDVLVGSDLYWKLVTGRVVRGENGPTAVETVFGWVLSGPLDLAAQEPFNVNPTCVLRIESQSLSADDTHLDFWLKRFWDLEAIGIADQEPSVYEDFVKKISFNDGHYEVHLPWKEPHLPLDDHYQLSLDRLTKLLRRLRRSPDILKEYDSVIKEQLSHGIVELVPETVASANAHYLPHHAVIRHDKDTTKLRIVYDASARTSGPSLNDCLYVGPPFGQSIFDIILRFRIHTVALAGDIEKAFLMVSVVEKDRDALRFLWVDDPFKKVPEVRTLRFRRVVFGVASSPFLLNATIQHHIEQYRSMDAEFVDQFLRSIYVDDVTYGSTDIRKMYDLYHWSKSKLAEGGFHLRKFVTNSSTMRELIAADELPISETDPDRAIAIEDDSYASNMLGDLQVTSPGEKKILGVCWNFDEDHLIFDARCISGAADVSHPTKRIVVSVATRFYDPLGILAPFIVQFKMLFQELCKAKISWDEPLTGDLLEKWRKLVADLKTAQPLIVPRQYFKEIDLMGGVYTLQGFCDASLRAYAAVVYLQVETPNGNHAQFVAAKTRVAPICGQTIPRLELLAAVLLAKLIKNVFSALEQEIPLVKLSCFTDSKAVLHWITSTNKEWRQFVQNRVNQIRSLVSSESWAYCPGSENPADMPSRGVGLSMLLKESRWIRGPAWLSKGEQPQGEPFSSAVPSECVPEMKTPKALSLLIDGSQSADPILDCEKYSSLQKLLRVTALVFKFVQVLQSKVKPTDTEAVNPKITLEDMQEATIYWIQKLQIPLWGDKCFQSWEVQFGLYKDEMGLLRCRGRLGNAYLPYFTKHPILLNANHHITELIVRHCHLSVKHGGVKETLTELRSSYWVVRGRNFVRRLLRQCVVCRRFAGKHYSVPLPAPLPGFRVREAPPFSSTGVDFAGPLFVRDSKDKVWLCLYTCCVTRAVHLDIVPGLSAQTFIHCFRRFVARRGLPQRVVSDNAKTFKSAKRLIKMTLEDPTVRRFFSNLQLTWTFNLEKAPWQGGFFERLIQSAKRCLKRTIGNSKLSYDELLTVVTEVELILNSRPLSYVSTEDLEEPLTPSHLITGRRLLSFPGMISRKQEDPDYQVTPSSPTDLSKRMRHLNKILDHFWRRWRKEYLTELREAHGRKRKCSESSTVEVGDIVLVHDKDHPQTFWKMARVEELIRSRDNQVRGARVRVGATGSMLRRPVQALYPLEVHAAKAEQSTETEPKRICATEHTRPLRAAAQMSRQMWREKMC